MKIYTKKTEIDADKTGKNFDIKDEKSNIKIYFTSGIDDKVRVLNKNKEIRCTKKDLMLDCEIDKKSLDDENVFKIIDLCGDEKYSFIVNKKPEDSKKGSKAWVVIIVLLSLIIVLFVLFLVYRAWNKKNNSNIEKIEGDSKIMPEV